MTHDTTGPVAPGASEPPVDHDAASGPPGAGSREEHRSPHERDLPVGAALRDLEASEEDTDEETTLDAAWGTGLPTPEQIQRQRALTARAYQGAGDVDPHTPRRFPTWFGHQAPFWWADASTSERRDALGFTVTFTEWLLRVWRWDKKVLPPCWVEHPDLVQEMWSLALAHHGLHSIDNPTGPAQWLLFLDYTLRRLRDNNAASGCAARGYHELPEPSPHITAQRRASYDSREDPAGLLPAQVFAWAWPSATPAPTETQEGHRR